MDFNRIELDELDAIIRRYFPKAKIDQYVMFSRDDSTWWRTIDLTYVGLELQIWRSGFPAGSVKIRLWGQPETGAESETLWGASGLGIAGLHACLKEAREKALGIAQGLLQICGDPPAMAPFPAEIHVGTDWGKVLVKQIQGGKESEDQDLVTVAELLDRLGI